MVKQSAHMACKKREVSCLDASQHNAGLMKAMLARPLQKWKGALKDPWGTLDGCRMEG